jgi:hypothetical protein
MKRDIVHLCLDRGSLFIVGRRILAEDDIRSRSAKKNAQGSEYPLQYGHVEWRHQVRGEMQYGTFFFT